MSGSTYDVATIEPDVPTPTKPAPIAPRGLTRRDDESDEAWEYRVDHARDRRELRAEAFRELAELLTDLDLADPSHVSSWSFTSRVDVTWEAADESTFVELRRSIGSTIDSPWNKDTEYGRLSVTRDVTPRLRVKIAASWGTCEKVTVGTKVVERYVDACPLCEGELVDVETTDGQRCASDQCSYVTVPPKRVQREVEEPIEEWRCPEVVDL